SRSTRTSSRSTARWCGCSAGGRYAARSVSARAAASSKAARKASISRSGSDAEALCGVMDQPVQFLAEALQDPLDRALRPAGLAGDVGDLVAGDAQVDDGAVRGRQRGEKFLDGQAEVVECLLVGRGGLVHGLVEGGAARGLAHIALGRLVVGGDRPDLV